jgi:lysophospholipase L1-like esterase
MLSVLFIVSGSFLLLIILILAIYAYKRFTLIDDLPFYPSSQLKNPVLTIGIIGDSWATYNKLDNLLHQELLNNGFENKIISSGQSGAKTRLIYQNLFKDNTSKNSCKFIIESNPDYCILLGGTNDAIGQMGSRYYSFHISKIIKFLLHYNIKPIVLTLPKIGVQEMNNNMNIFQRYRNRLSAFFNNGNQIENVESYRKKLLEILKNEQLIDKILLIDFDKACEKYEKDSDLYKNPIHLSNTGNKKLAGFIAKELIQELKNQQVPMHSKVQ